jgi:hypothetical protein
MRREREAAKLAEVAAIRGLQKLRAEAETQKALARSREKSAALEEREKERASSEAGWTAAVSEASVPLESARMWSAQLLKDEDGARRAAQDAAKAEDDAKRRAEERHIAAMRADAAEDLTRRARKHETRQRDEIALQDALDRHLQKRGSR